MGQLTIKILLFFMPTGGEPACGVVGSVHSGILFVNHVRTHHTIHTYPVRRKIDRDRFEGTQPITRSFLLQDSSLSFILTVAPFILLDATLRVKNPVGYGGVGRVYDGSLAAFC